MALNFEWDANKAKSKLGKHRISFEEASTVFGSGRPFWLSVETHSLPTLTRSYPRHFTFYVAAPVSSIAGCRPH
jgi:hypothetical protein